MRKLIAATGALLLVVVSGAAYSHDDQHAKHCSLPPEKKEILHQAMHAAHEKNEALIEKKHQLHEELHAILAAPKFDKGKFLAKHRELQEVENKMQNNMVASLASVAGQFTPEERMKLAKILHHHHHHHGSEHHEHAGNDDWHHPPTKATRENETESQSPE